MPHFKDPSSLQRALSWDRSTWDDPKEQERMRNYIALQLASSGLLSPTQEDSDGSSTVFSGDMLKNFREKSRLHSGHRAPVDNRIETFLTRYFSDQENVAPFCLPSGTLVLDRHGMARQMSLPVDRDEFQNGWVDSYRCDNGVLNNPLHDRRTTGGTFHVVDGGLPVAGDKRLVPKNAFVKLFQAAFQPPQDLMLLPYTATANTPVHTWVSLLLRPLVSPGVTGVCDPLTMEIRFFAPASLISNLDFVESIFGNAGDPMLPINDAGIDVCHWTGHSGCVVLAPHLTTLTKKEVGLPPIDKATDRQRRDRMCWESPDECYNDGTPFKVTCRDASGVIVTLIADNYYGYCKKEVKTQISFAANLMGGAEEEHAGGALVFASYSLGDEFKVNSRRYNGGTFDDVAKNYGSSIDVQPEGYGIDRNWPSVIYIPENARITLLERCVKWKREGKEYRIPLSPEEVYIAPSGYTVRMLKHPSAPSWRLTGTVGEGIFCHKPCTVSGGGKSEISKSLNDYMLYGPIFVADQEDDFRQLNEIFGRNYQDRWHSDYKDKPSYSERPSRPLLAPKRSLGSVIQLLTPSPDFSDTYNRWLASIPDHIYALALIIKRFIKPGMEDDWQAFFSVDIVNGSPGHELKLKERRLVGTYLRVGHSQGRWRTFKLRQDFIAASKIQREDDISVSTILPANQLANVGPGVAKQESYKFVENCEFRLFQRPDDAIHRGLDKQTESDLSKPGTFLCNFQPLDSSATQKIVGDVIDFDAYTQPMQNLLRQASEKPGQYVVSSAHPRINQDGSLCRNPRYLQDRPDRVNARDTYIAECGMRLFRKLSPEQAVHVPVGAILSGRLNNPPDPKQGHRSLAVYSPLHYQALPELVMDYVCSLTGKSPSTTGAGSEGALTKGPFNAMVPTIDLNAAVVGLILTGLGGFSTPAGYIGPNLKVGHDISLLIPEIWCRMGPNERDPDQLIANGMLEPIKNFEFQGQTIPASRLGYRITERFVRKYMARVFDNPGKVFTDEILRPETQDLDSFADGILHIAEAQQKVAQRYLDDGSLALACPPLQAILTIMAQKQWRGLDAQSPEVRQLFTRESLLNSDWYLNRLRTKQQRDTALWRRAVEALENYPHHKSFDHELGLSDRLRTAKERLQEAQQDAYIESLRGTIGADPMEPIDV